MSLTLTLTEEEVAFLLNLLNQEERLSRIGFGRNVARLQQIDEPVLVARVKRHNEFLTKLAVLQRKLTVLKEQGT